MDGGFEHESESVSVCMVTLRDFHFGREVVFYARVACQVLFCSPFIDCFSCIVLTQKTSLLVMCILAVFLLK
jgi:hypothetical protein